MVHLPFLHTCSGASCVLYLYSRPFSCPQSSSKGRFTISQLLSLHLFLWPNLRKIWRQYRSVLASTITCIWHKMKSKAATWTDAQAAQRRRRCKQVAFLPAFLIFHPQMLLVGSSVARMLVERGRSRKRSHQLLCPTSYLERVYKKEPLNVHYPPSTLGEAIRKLSFCRR